MNKFDCGIMHSLVVFEQVCRRGEVIQVKVLGIMALIDEGL